MIQPQEPAPPTDVSFRHSWDTAIVPPDDRFSYFREAVCQTSLALTPENPSGQVVDARMVMADLPRGIINKVDITPLRVIRTNRDLAKIPGEFLALTMQVTGSSSRWVNERRHVELPGDIALIDCNQPIDIDANSETRYRSTNIIFDKGLLTEHVDFKDILMISRHAVGAIAGCMQLIDDRYEVASQSELAHLLHASISLLIASLIKDSQYLEYCSVNENDLSSGLLQAIKDHVVKRLADPNLSAPNIAHDFAVSSRYVQKLFAFDGSTLKTFITNARLERIQMDLLDRTLAHLSAGEIAFKWGFRDMTTVHRNFKRRFGDTPAQMRMLREDKTRRPKEAMASPG